MLKKWRNTWRNIIKCIVPKCDFGSIVGFLSMSMELDRIWQHLVFKKNDMQF